MTDSELDFDEISARAQAEIRFEKKFEKQIKDDNVPFPVKIVNPDSWLKFAELNNRIRKNAI